MRRWTVALAILSCFVLPFAFVIGGVIPVDQRRWWYALAGLLALGVARWTGASLRDLGFRGGNARAAVLPYTAFALLGAVVIVVVAVSIGRVPRTSWWLVPHFRYGILIPVSAAQEFFYRGLLTVLLQRLTASPSAIIVANASLFAFLHTIFPEPAVVLPLSFLGGFVFTALWLRLPNLWLASAAHAVLNFVFVLFCFGSFETSCTRV